MGFSRQEYWSGLPFPSPGDLPDPGIEPASPALEADALPSEPQGSPFVPAESRMDKRRSQFSLSAVTLHLKRKGKWQLLRSGTVL